MSAPSLSTSSSAFLRSSALRSCNRAASRRASLVVAADSRKAVVVLTGTAGVAGEVVFTQEGSGASLLRLARLRR